MSFSEWKEVKLGEIGEIVGGGTPSTKKESYYGGNISWITPKDLSTHKERYIFRGERSITEEGLANSSAKLMPKGTVLFSSRAPIGYVAIAGKELCTNQGFKSLIPKTRVADSEFIYYLLKHKKSDIEAIASGTTFLEVSGSAMKNFNILLPPLPEQKAIAATLSALDDMIELNNQINKTLEEIAQAIFKSWFVDFEPFKDGEFQESELGLIPKGWRVGTVGDLCTDIFSGGTPLTSNSKFWNGKHPWLASGETRTSIIVKTEKSITDEGVVNSSTRLAKKYDIVIASAGQGHTRGQTAITLIDTYINQSVIALRAEVYGYLFCNLRNRYYELRAISDSSSIRGSLTTKIMNQFPILLPPEEVLTAFQSIFEEIIEYCGQSALENVTLSEIRDTLLPKLMSGEIRVPVEEAV